MRSPLNRGSARQMLRLFDYCFKQGVLDACRLEDDYEARAFLDRRIADGGYGVLGEPEEDFDWRKWQFTIYRYCRFNRLNKLGEEYIDRVHKYHSSFLFAAVPISMRFYLEGVREYLAYPNPMNTAIFMQNKKVHWDQNIPKRLRSMSTSDFILLIQQFVYERQQKQYDGDITMRQYDQFANAMWSLTTRFPVYAYKEEGI